MEDVKSYLEASLRYYSSFLPLRDHYERQGALVCSLLYDLYS